MNLFSNELKIFKKFEYLYDFNENEFSSIVMIPFFKIKKY